MTTDRRPAVRVRELAAELGVSVPDLLMEADDAVGERLKRYGLEGCRGYSLTGPKPVMDPHVTPLLADLLRERYGRST